MNEYAFFVFYQYSLIMMCCLCSVEMGYQSYQIAELEYMGNAKWLHVIDLFLYYSLLLFSFNIHKKKSNTINLLFKTIRSLWNHSADMKNKILTFFQLQLKLCLRRENFFPKRKLLVHFQSMWFSVYGNWNINLAEWIIIFRFVSLSFFPFWVT